MKMRLPLTLVLAFGLMLSAPKAFAEDPLFVGEPMQANARDWQPGAKEIPQSVLSWSSKVRFRKGELRLRLRDSHNRPVEQAQVSAVLAYPGQPELAFTVKLIERGKGTYSAVAPLTAKGQWTVTISATKFDREYDSVATISVD